MRFGQCNVLHSDMKPASKLTSHGVGTRSVSSFPWRHYFFMRAVSPHVRPVN